MSLPEGVSTCNVTFGKALSQFGTVARLTGKVTMDRRVIHAATGYSLNPADEDAPRSDDDDLLSFAVPHVDQEGFLDPATQLATTHWYYTLSGKIIFAGGGKTLSFTKTFQPLVGQTDIDLDFLPDGTPTPGVTAPTAEVSSVAGQTGHVSTSALRTALGVDTLEEDLDGKADLDETGRVGYPQLPDALSPSGLLASNAFIVSTVEPDTGANVAASLQAQYAAANGKPLRLVKPGVYLVDGLTLTQPGTLHVGPGVTLKLADSAVGTAGIAPVVLITSSDVSVIVEGTLHGNRSGQNLAAYNAAGGTSGGKAYSGIRVRGTSGSRLSNVIVRARRITEVTDLAVDAQYVETGDFHVVGDNCGSGLVLTDCGTVSVPVAFFRSLDNAGAKCYPHGLRATRVNKAIFGALTVVDHYGNGSVAGGTALSNWITGASFQNVTDVTITSMLLATREDVTQSPGVGFELSTVENLRIGSLSIEGYSDTQLEFGGVANWQIGQLDLDGRYQQNHTGNPGGNGWVIYNIGYYPGNTSRSQRFTERGIVSSFNIRRHLASGIDIRAARSCTFMSGKLFGNLRGVHQRFIATDTADNFANQQKREPELNRFIAVDAFCNERSGFEIEDGANTDLIDCRAWNNYQCATTSGATTRKGSAIGGAVRAGIAFNTGVVGLSKTGARVIHPRCFDNQGFTDYLSGTPTTGATLSAYNPHRYVPGQTVKLVGAGAAGADLITRVNSVDKDEVTLETAPSTFPTVAGSGTISTTGTAVTGSGTTFNTELNGRFWIVVGGNARQIIKVASNTSATLASAFPSNLSGQSFAIYRTTVSGLRSQDYPVRFSADCVTPILVGGEFEGHLVSNRLRDDSGKAHGGGMDRRYSTRRATMALPDAASYGNLPRHAAFSATAAPLASGRLQLAAVRYEVGDVVTSIDFYSGTTAGGSMTNQWFSLWSPALAKLAVTSDDTSTAWGANAKKSLALSSPYTITEAGWYYHGIVVVGSTMPTLMSVTANLILNGLAPALAGGSTTGLTDPASAPSTADAVGGSSVIPLTTAS